MINDNTLKEGADAADLDYENMSEEEVTKRMQAGIAGLLANLEQSVRHSLPSTRRIRGTDAECLSTARTTSAV
jgi:hypothetical protein